MWWEVEEVKESGVHKHLVCLVKLCTDVTPEEVASTPGAEAPAFDILWIRPQQIAHGPIVRHFLLSVYRANLKHTHPGFSELIGQATADCNSSGTCTS